MSSAASHPAKVVSAGIDWVTATCRRGNHGTLLTVLAKRWRDIHESEGHRVKPWEWQGYRGHSMDSISSGTRDDGTIIRLSGDLARQRAPQLLALVDNVSRLDVQVTVQEQPPSTNFAMVGLAAAQRDPRVRAGITRTSLIQSTPVGTTAYIGSRVSGRHFRIYDKSAESNGVYPPGCWRFEIEYKGSRAISVGERLRSVSRPDEACREVVEQAFWDYGVELPCVALPSGWRDSSPRMETTDERRLRWLETCIAPVVGRMMESFDRRTVLKALGVIFETQDETVDVSTEEIILE